MAYTESEGPRVQEDSLVPEGHMAAGRPQPEVDTGCMQAVEAEQVAVEQQAEEVENAVEAAVAAASADFHSHNSRIKLTVPEVAWEEHSDYLEERSATEGCT